MPTARPPSSRRSTAASATLSRASSPTARTLPRVTADALPALALEQAALPAKCSGVGLISHMAVCHAAYVAGYNTVALAYMREHHTRLLVTPSADPDGAPTSDTPALLAVLRFAYARLGTQSADGASPLSSLLSGSPRSQHDLSEGVHEKSADELLASLSSEADRARVRTCGGQWAGLWLAAASRSWFARVRGVHYSIALRVRLGVPLRELQPRDGAASVTCGGCGHAVDAFGRHYSSCKNRGNCWTHRHDCVEMSLIRQARIGRARATSTVGKGNLFGTPALSSKKSLRYGWRLSLIHI